jgi:Family of unknown function (DUF6132)
MKSKLLKTSLWIAGGAGLGLSYYLFVGCNSGGCAITSDPWISSGYGAIVGLLMSRT